MTPIYWIRWGRKLASNYRYGTRITIQPTQNRFVDPRESPGKMVHVWMSKSRYLGGRQTADLPLLTPDLDYRFKLVGQIEPADTIHLRLTYFDADEEELDTEYFNEAGHFHYPDEARSYKMELVNLNNQVLKFTGIWLAASTVFDSFDVTTEVVNGQPVVRANSKLKTKAWQTTVIGTSDETTTMPLLPELNNLLLGVEPQVAVAAVPVDLPKQSTIRTFGRQGIGVQAMERMIQAQQEETTK
ncbi:hypothetical protein IV38_GL001906 [Lactobacillus selangorensis]|uniref:Accessory Sec system protein Asp3 n=1 Tax=Lactobacillus selangorensis TaxID=81857 RepID=A0A0R2FSG0_9LACO|nr:accessory Sec system protein Asp3 [Lactobacillus selangorensis]KRN27693.1 hypothetical protein IV38_GL001906 [Lactobacillus selangorensis]KRN30342.1 hypothetical protein IV40_GL001931 [Lactobacillus selangorensis]